MKLHDQTNKLAKNNVPEEKGDSIQFQFMIAVATFALEVTSSKANKSAADSPGNRDRGTVNVSGICWPG